jgi:uncharacterized repeat protein (TIGR03803 family)
MTSCIRRRSTGVNLALVLILLAVGCLASGRSDSAQVYTKLHSFLDGSVIDDGIRPSALVDGTDGDFYGTTSAGGSNLGTKLAFPSGGGTAFKITPSGVETILHSFGDGSVPNDGLAPSANLILARDGNFYGTTFCGGSTYGGVADNGDGWGTIFKMSPAGAVTNLHSFGDGSVQNDGVYPSGPLVQASNGNFYSTCAAGGSANAGTVFETTSAGVVAILHSFQDGSVPNDGSAPEGGLALASDGDFYGTTQFGGSTVGQGSYGLGYGTAYKLTPAGSVTILHSFSDGSVTNDGQQPTCALIQSTDGNLCGTTEMGGAAEGTPGNTTTGTVFRMTMSGSLTILHSFDLIADKHDGSLPQTGVIQGADGSFYGTTIDGSYGDVIEYGTVYKITLPQIAGISPESAPPGSLPLTLTVNGKGFAPGSQVEFNGTAVATTVVGDKQITAVIPVSLLTSARNASAAVQGPSGVVSNSDLFLIGGPVLESVTLMPSRVIGGNPSTGTVTLTGAPTVPITIKLSSSRGGMVSPKTVINWVNPRLCRATRKV